MLNFWQGGAMTPVLSLEVMSPKISYLLSSRSDVFYSITSVAVPMVESMAALVLMDQLMAHIAQCEMFPLNLALQEPIGSASSASELAPNLS
jgi:chorismate synthase